MIKCIKLKQRDTNLANTESCKVNERAAAKLFINAHLPLVFLRMKLNTILCIPTNIQKATSYFSLLIWRFRYMYTVGLAEHLIKPLFSLVCIYQECLINTLDSNYKKINLHRKTLKINSY